MKPDLGVKPGPHWWEASALTTVPSLQPQDQILLLLCQALWRILFSIMEISYTQAASNGFNEAGKGMHMQHH